MERSKRPGIGGILFAKFENDVKNDIGKLASSKSPDKNSPFEDEISPLKEHKDRLRVVFDTFMKNKFRVANGKFQ